LALARLTDQCPTVREMHGCDMVAKPAGLGRRLRTYCSFAYSIVACFRMGMSGLLSRGEIQRREVSC
jgi:hypothetical protein